jgi:hypothetical protein
MCHPFRRNRVACVADSSSGKKFFCHVIWCMSAFSSCLESVYMMIMSSLVIVQFSFLPFISLSPTLFYATSMKKNHRSPWIFFSLQIWSMFFELQLFYLNKLLQIGKQNSIISSFSFSSLKFGSCFFFQMTYKFYLFLAIHSHSFCF